MLAPFVLAGLLGPLYAFWKVLSYYWSQRHLRNIPGPEAGSFAAGNIRQLYAPDCLEFIEDISQKYGPVMRVNGMFGDSQLYVFDPVALYSIYVKDQYVYDVTEAFVQTNLLIVGPGLFATVGEHHRKQRKLLNPVFHIAHMRQILPIFFEIAHSLRDKIQGKITPGGTEIDMLHILAFASLEIIGQGALGYSFEKEATEDKKDGYGRAIHAILPSTGTQKMVLFIRFSPWVVKFGPARFRRWLIQFAPKDVQKTRSIIDTMYAASDSILDAKKERLQRGDAATVEEIGRGKDVMSLLMKANLDASDEDRLPEAEIRAQMTSFLLAGMDTTSGALSRIMHQLALNPEAQATLREELVEARERNGGDLSYDDLQALPYLEAVVRETLRLFPPLFISARTTRRDIMMPLSTPVIGKDGTVYHEIFVPKDTNIMAGLLSANRNAALWGEDVREWKPERWLEALPQALLDARIPGVYSHTMSFIGGSRACIGFKFAQMSIKVILATLVPSFQFDLPETAEIVWETRRLQAPCVKGSPDSQLPLRVTPIIQS